VSSVSAVGKRSSGKVCARTSSTYVSSEGTGERFSADGKRQHRAGSSLRSTLYRSRWPPRAAIFYTHCLPANLSPWP